MDKNNNPIKIDGKEAKASCNIKVMASGKEKTGLTGEKKYPTLKGDYCYVIKNLYYSPEEIESYITNGEMLVQKYPDKFVEGKEYKINTFKQKSKYKNLYFGRNYGTSSNYYRNGNRDYPKEMYFDHDVILKEKGKIDTNGYLILFTSKTQHLYLLQKQNGKLYMMQMFQVEMILEVTINNLIIIQQFIDMKVLDLVLHGKNGKNLSLIYIVMRYMHLKKELIQDILQAMDVFI